MRNFVQNKVVNICQRMSIDCSQIHPSHALGIEIGMDSQEIIEFTCAIEQEFNISIKPFTFHKETLFSEVSEKVTQALQESSLKNSSHFLENFSGFCEKEIVIDKKRQDVFDAIYYLEEWPSKLAHIKSISILYNDGKFQEFLMTVESSGVDVVEVRSVRRCDKEQFNIRFFQPKPPIYLQHHCGGWSFQALSSASCLVKTWHQWNLNEPIAKKKFQTQDLKQCDEMVKNILASHAELALTRWKTNLEST
jgi:hypothetical protein